MNFFIYSRKSVYTGKGESTENQIEMCREYIKSKFPEDINHSITVYEDEGFSAKDMNRPQFIKMIKDIKTSPPDFIICYRLDRISRSVSDFSSFIEMLNVSNISFICIKEEFDTSKPVGKAMMYIASVFSQLERETTAERVKDNMLMLARTGRWLGGTPPTGYKSEKVYETTCGNKTRTHCKLVPVKDEIIKIKKIYRIFLSCMNIRDTAEKLKMYGITSRNGNIFSPVVIKQILTNPVYCIADNSARKYFAEKNSDICFEEKDCSSVLGLAVYNKRDYSKKNVPKRPEENWIVAIGEHEGIIKGSEWTAVQNTLSSSAKCRAENSKHNFSSFLSGIIFCRECGELMTAKLRSKSSSTRSYDYICSKKLKKGAAFCHSNNIKGISAEYAVLTALVEFIVKGSCCTEINYENERENIIYEIPYDIFSRTLIGSVEKIIWTGSELHIYI